NGHSQGEFLGVSVDRLQRSSCDNEGDASTEYRPGKVGLRPVRHDDTIRPIEHSRADKAELGFLYLIALLGFALPKDFENVWLPPPQHGDSLLTLRTTLGA